MSTLSDKVAARLCKHRRKFKRYRVQLSPSTDRWMMGDRYGEVTAAPKTGRHAGCVRVKLDKSGRSIWFKRENVNEL